MAYHDDLIEHAISLLGANLSDEPKQVDLRRAVSAAYYALFHLLTTEAAQNWKHQSQRYRFARMFDHGRMRKCSSSVSSRPLPTNPAEIATATDLKLVADSFGAHPVLGALVFAQTATTSTLQQGFSTALGIMFMFGFLWGVLKIWSGANAISKGDPDGKAGIIAGIIIAGAAAIMGALFAIFGLSGATLTPSF